MNHRTLALGVLTIVFLIGASWVASQQGATKLALAPEISAIKTQKESGVLGYQDKQPADLGSSVDAGGYLVTIKDKQEISFEMCRDEKNCLAKETKKAIQYSVAFDLTKTNLDDDGLNNFIINRLGNNYLMLVDGSGNEYPMQDIGGMPLKTIRFLVEKVDSTWTLDFRSKEMLQNNQKAISWRAE